MKASFQTNYGVERFYEDVGSGNPLVLVHGWTASHRTFHVLECSSYFCCEVAINNSTAALNSSAIKHEVSSIFKYKDFRSWNVFRDIHGAKLAVDGGLTAI